VIVENGETLVNCLAYIDLNPMRAGMGKRPEDYRWISLGYHFQTNNKDNFLSTDFGMKEFGAKTKRSGSDVIAGMYMRQGLLVILKKAS
jgi:hypothetical protein